VAGSPEEDVAVDLVGDDDHAPGGADAGEPFQFLPGPDPSAGVVGRAQEDELHRGVVQLFLQVGEVHLEPAAGKDQRVFHHTAPPPGDGGKEGVIDRRLDEHTVSGLGEGEDGGGQCRDHAGGMADPLGVGSPSVPPFEPPGNSLPVGGKTTGIAENPVIRPFPEDLDDLRRGLEVHVGHPHGKKIAGTEDGLHAVPLCADSAAPFDDSVKIVAVHSCSSLSLKMHSMLRESSISYHFLLIGKKSEVSVPLVSCFRTW